jgi:hypothetical protein
LQIMVVELDGTHSFCGALWASHGLFAPGKRA